MAIPVSIPGKSTSKNGLINNRWNLFRGFVCAIEDKIFSAMESLSKKHAKPEFHISGEDPDSVFYESSTKHEQKKCATVTDSSDTVDQNKNSDFFDGDSETKASLQETLISLDLIGKYLELPSEENAKPLFKFAHCARRKGLPATFLDEDPKKAFENDSTVGKMETKVNFLNNKILDQEEETKSLLSEGQEVLADLGELLFEKSAKEIKEREAEVFNQIFSTPKQNRQKEKTSSGEGIKSHRHEVKTINMPSSSRNDVETQNSAHQSGNGVNGSNNVATSSEEQENVQSNSNHPKYEGLPFSVQQDDSNGRECISLCNKPPTSVAAMLYNNYKLLLLNLSQSLLSSDVIKLKDWANHNFSIENAQNATDVIFKLDEKRVINAGDLSNLRGFFESIIRYDLLHMIDAFLLGDYNLLRQVPGPKIRQTVRSVSRYLNVSAFNVEIPTTGGNAGNPATTRKPSNSNMVAFPSSLKHTNASNPKPAFRSRNENQPTAHEQQDLKPIATGFSSSKVTDVVVPDGPVSCKFFTFLKQFYMFQNNFDSESHA